MVSNFKPLTSADFFVLLQAIVWGSAAVATCCYAAGYSREVDLTGVNEFRLQVLELILPTFDDFQS